MAKTRHETEAPSTSGAAADQNVYPPGDRAPRSPEEEMKETKTARFPVGGLISLIAGAAILIGSFLAWIELSTPVVAFQGGRVTGPKTGLDSVFGIVSIAAAALVIVGALLWIARRSRRVLGVLVLFAGTAATATGLYFLLTLESRFIAAAVDEAASPDLSAAKIEDLLSQLLAAGTLDVRPGIGLFVVLAGSGLAVVVGIAGLMRRRLPGGAAKSW